MQPRVRWIFRAKRDKHYTKTITPAQPDGQPKQWVPHRVHLAGRLFSVWTGTTPARTQAPLTYMHFWQQEPKLLFNFAFLALSMRLVINTGSLTHT